MVTQMVLSVVAEVVVLITQALKLKVVLEVVETEVINQAQLQLQQKMQEVKMVLQILVVEVVLLVEGQVVHTQIKEVVLVVVDK